MIHYSSRNDLILSYCRDKDVLDVGSTGQTSAYNLWTEIKRVAHTVMGIDVNPSQDPELVVGNMETYQFNKEFDVVVAGDILEHVLNQGLFLKNIIYHLKPNGNLILTTPNAKWPTVFLKPNPTHTLWHDKYTLSFLLKLAGFQIEVFGYYLGNKPRYPIWLRPLIWRQGIIAVCRL